jgi:WD40 repeat protein
LIKQYDLDNDQRLSQVEIKKMRRPPNSAAALLDGFINEAEMIAFLSGKNGRSVNTDFSADGTLLAVSIENQVFVYDAASGVQLRAFIGIKGPIRKMTISSDGRMLAVCASGQVKVWDIAFGDELSRLEEGASTAAFDSSGFRLVTASGANIKVWDVMSGEELCKRESPNSDEIKRVEFSPDDSWLVGIDSKGIVHLWDTGRRSRRTRLSDLSQLFVDMNYENPDLHGPAKDDLRNMISAKKVGRQLSFVQQFKECGIPDCELKVTKSYDLDSLMLVRREANIIQPETDQESPFETLKLSWKEYDGVQVPVKVKSEKHLAKKIRGKMEAGMIVMNITLDWISVNESVDKSFFDGSRLESVDVVQKQLELAKQLITDGDK